MATKQDVIIPGELKEWITDCDYAAIRKSVDSFEWTLYKEDFGDSALIIDGKQYFGEAATIYLMGFTDTREAFEAATDFYCSEHFPCSDAEIEKRGDRLFWREWTKDGSAEWEEYTIA